MLEQKVKEKNFGDGEKAQEEIEQLETMLTWAENPKVMRKGVDKALSILPLYPEKVLKEVGRELGEALTFLDDARLKSRAETVLGKVARDYVDKVGREELREMSTAENWYVRWLSLWVMNNMVYEDAGCVPTDQLDILLNDEDERVGDFARRVANRIEKLKISQV
ncbi:MAG: hypothetical protein ACLFTQ_01245 [Candidatus Aenigmatarchaeota archaeon]